MFYIIYCWWYRSTDCRETSSWLGWDHLACKVGKSVYPTKLSNSKNIGTNGFLLPNMFLVEQYGMSLNIVKYRIGALFFLIGAGCLCTSIYYNMKQCSKRKRRIHQNDGNQPVMESKSSVTKVTLTNCKETSICNDQSIYDNLNTVWLFNNDLSTAISFQFHLSLIINYYRSIRVRVRPVLKTNAT